jgi:hypothetical protein
VTYRASQSQDPAPFGSHPSPRHPAGLSPAQERDPVRPLAPGRITSPARPHRAGLTARILAFADRNQGVAYAIAAAFAAMLGALIGSIGA